MSIRVSNVTTQVLFVTGKTAIASSTLSLSQFVLPFLAVADRQVVEDIINFQQTTDDALSPIIEDDLGLVQTLTTNIDNQFPSSIVGLRDAAVPCFGAPWLPIEVTTELQLTDKASRSETLPISDVLVFVDEAATVESEDQFIDFSQEVLVGIGWDLQNTIALTDLVETQSDFLRSVADTDVVRQSMTYFIDNGCFRKTYARFVGDGDADPISEQRLTFDSSFSLESISDGTVLLLRNPETDDRDRLGFNRINRETRGGELNVFGDPVWAKVNTLLFTILALSDGKGQCPDVIGQTLQFFQDNLGQEIYLHDWTGTTWLGVVTTPNEVATEDREGWWTLSFEFEGEALPGSAPDSTMGITDQLTLNADWTRSVSDDLALTDTTNLGGAIYQTISDDLELSDTIDGVQEITIFDDDLSSGSAVDLDGTSPTIGTSTWRAHENYQDDGSQTAPVNAGAFYPISLSDDTVYELTILGAFVSTFSNGDSCIWGFFEGISTDNMITGATAWGKNDPTTIKAAHLMRDDVGGSRLNSFRRGSDSDGEADTQQWTDASLRTSPDSVLDLRVTIDTKPSIWAALWEAKSVINPTYTQVGSDNMLSENIGSVGWSNDNGNTDLNTDRITLKELRPI